MKRIVPTILRTLTSVGHETKVTSVTQILQRTVFPLAPVDSPGVVVFLVDTVLGALVSATG